MPYSYHTVLMPPNQCTIKALHHTTLHTTLRRTTDKPPSHRPNIGQSPLTRQAKTRSKSQRPLTVGVQIFNNCDKSLHHVSVLDIPDRLRAAINVRGVASTDGNCLLLTAGYNNYVYAKPPAAVPIPIAHESFRIESALLSGSYPVAAKCSPDD